jgi:hypothetical protein
MDEKDDIMSNEEFLAYLKAMPGRSPGKWRTREEAFAHLSTLLEDYPEIGSIEVNFDAAEDCEPEDDIEYFIDGCTEPHHIDDLDDAVLEYVFKYVLVKIGDWREAGCWGTIVIDTATGKAHVDCIELVTVEREREFDV